MRGIQIEGMRENLGEKGGVKRSVEKGFVKVQVGKGAAVKRRVVVVVVGQRFGARS